jgi:hypothetical protein
MRGLIRVEIQVLGNLGCDIPFPWPNIRDNWNRHRRHNDSEPFDVYLYYMLV